MKKHICLLIIIFSSGIIFSLAGLGTTALKYNEARATYSKLQTLYNEVSTHIEATKPVEVIDPFTKAMKAINPDYVAWLSIDETCINYPIVLTPSDKYLDHDFYGDESFFGCLFVFSPQKAFEESNTIIYGHNMKDGSMFGSLKNYLNKSYYNEHKTLTITYNNKIYQYQVFSIQVINENYSDAYVYGLYGAEQSAYVEKMKKHSKVATEPIPEGNTNIITLSTCYGRAGSQNRLIIQGIKQ